MLQISSNIIISYRLLPFSQRLHHSPYHSASFPALTVFAGVSSVFELEANCSRPKELQQQHRLNQAAFPSLPFHPFLPFPPSAFPVPYLAPFLQLLPFVALLDLAQY